MSHTSFYSPAAERHRTLAGTHFPSRGEGCNVSNKLMRCYVYSAGCERDAVLLQSEVAESASRCDVLLGSGGAKHDASDRLPDDVGPLRVQRANGRLRVRVSARNDTVVASIRARDAVTSLFSLHQRSPVVNKLSRVCLATSFVTVSGCSSMHSARKMALVRLFCCIGKH